MNPKPSGTTLVEALVALTVVMITGAAAVSLLLSAIENAKLSRDYLVAQNLATEGLESLRGILASNQLIFPAGQVKDGPDNDISDCWNAIVVNVSDGTCNDKIAIGKHYVVGPYGRVLIPKGNELNLTNGYGTNDAYKLGEKKLGSVGIYFPTPDPTSPAFDKFYRELYVKSVDDDHFSVMANVIVQWKDGAKVNNFQTGTREITAQSSI